MKQTQITHKGKLLDEHGHLIEKGYATSLLREYSRKDVKAKRRRIKEWDYYFFGNKDIGVALTIADNSYMSLVGATFFDFKHKVKKDFKRIKFFSNGKLNMPNDSLVGDIYYHDRKITFSVKLSAKGREIYCKIPKFKRGESFEFNADVTYTNDDSMVIVTPFKEDPKAFYYNQKINNLVANGSFTVGATTYKLENEQGVLDWGRGVWTRDNTWYWSSASFLLPDGSPCGFNLGYGFGDTSAASENMVFYNKKAYKLNDVDFGIPEPSFTDPWHFTSKDGAIDLIFTPLYDNRTDINVGFLRQDAHQVFGEFTGTIKISPTETLQIKNGFGFAEKVRNVW